jgi:uncharacterized protein YodC (DUF2158 family)
MKATGKCEEFEVVVGAVVQLRSGGPSMVVEAVECRHHIHGDEVIVETVGAQCVWFDANNIVQRAAFVPAALQEASWPG